MLLPAASDLARPAVGDAGIGSGAGDGPSEAADGPGVAVDGRHEGDEQARTGLHQAPPRSARTVRPLTAECGRTDPTDVHVGDRTAVRCRERWVGSTIALTPRSRHPPEEPHPHGSLPQRPPRHRPHPRPRRLRGRPARHDRPAGQPGLRRSAARQPRAQRRAPGTDRPRRRRRRRRAHRPRRPRVGARAVDPWRRPQPGRPRHQRRRHRPRPGRDEGHPHRPRPAPGLGAARPDRAASTRTRPPPTGSRRRSATPARSASPG